MFYSVGSIQQVTCPVALSWKCCIRCLEAAAHHFLQVNSVLVSMHCPSVHQPSLPCRREINTVSLQATTELLSNCARFIFNMGYLISFGSHNNQSEQHWRGIAYVYVRHLGVLLIVCQWYTSAGDSYLQQCSMTFNGPNVNVFSNIM